MNEQEQEFTLVLSAQDINVIGSALGNIAYNAANPVLNKIQQSINEQVTDIPTQEEL